MEHDPATGLALVIVVGVGAQWLASVLRLPSILLLLGSGVLVGPVLGWLEPVELFGDLLFPGISMAVGLLLFEGGLGLRFDQLGPGRTVLLRLITLGMLLTWGIGATAVWLFADTTTATAVLVGSILVVSGPTVIGPLLRLSRPREPSLSILRWEGILIDPIGALLAIVVLEAVIEDEGVAAAVQRILASSGAGLAAGMLGALALVTVLRRHWVPDHLQNSVTLLVVVGVFAAANHVQGEAGLFATTSLGIALANQRIVAVGHIREFEENLGSLILAALFIVLGANLDLDLIAEYLPSAVAVLAALVFVARPLAVMVATIGTDVSIPHRAFVAMLAPRGIVAAAVASVFSIELAEAGGDAEPIVPIVYTVILGTVAIYGLSAPFAAHRLKIASAQPRGLLLLGAPSWALDLASKASDLGVPVMVVTTSQRELTRAVERGLLTYTGTLDSVEFLLAVQGMGARQAIALSRQSDLNAYGIVRLVEALGRANVFHVPSDDDDDMHAAAETAAAGRRAFGPTLTQEDIQQLMRDGWKMEVVSGDEVAADAASSAIPLLLVTGSSRIDVPVAAAQPSIGQQLIVLMPPSTDGPPAEDVATRAS